MMCVGALANTISLIGVPILFFLISPKHTLRVAENSENGRQVQGGKKKVIGIICTIIGAVLEVITVVATIIDNAMHSGNWSSYHEMNAYNARQSTAHGLMVLFGMVLLIGVVLLILDSQRRERQ